MNTIQSLFQQAQLAEAAYAILRDSAGNLITDVDGVKTALQDQSNKRTKGTGVDFFLMN